MTDEENSGRTVIGTRSCATRNTRSGRSVMWKPTHRKPGWWRSGKTDLGAAGDSGTTKSGYVCPTDGAWSLWVTPIQPCRTYGAKPRMSDRCRHAWFDQEA